MAKTMTETEAAKAMHLAHSKKCAQFQAVVKDGNADAQETRKAALAGFAHMEAMCAYDLFAVGAVGAEMAFHCSVETAPYGGASFDPEALDFMENAAGRKFLSV